MKTLTEEHKARIGESVSKTLKGKPSWRKGKTAEELYGIERAQYLRKNVWGKHLKGKEYPGKIPRKFQYCACGCGEGKEVKTNLNKRIFIRGHNARLNNPCYTHRLLGSANPSWKGGKSKCNICGKETSSYAAKQCRKCYFDFVKPWNKGLKKETDVRVRKNALATKRTITHLAKNDSTYIKNHLENHWSRKPVRASTIEKCLVGFKEASKHPNKFEIKVEEILNTIFPSSFIYVGNKRLGRKGYNPDFISKKSKMVVLCNGCYWHLEKRGLDVTDKNKRIVEKIEAEPFISIGYKVMFIWDDEINRKTYVE
jgi:very-short-patch-repair endonuclease